MLRFEDILQCQESLRYIAIQTPVYESPYFSNKCGCSVFLKCENLQKTGSFKLRGAANAVRKQSIKAGVGRPKMIVACSAGNHGLGVALSASVFGIPATIVVPTSTPDVKVSSIKSHKAHVELHGSEYDDAEVYAKQLAATIPGAHFISPYNNYDVMCGQGTVGLEIMQVIPDAQDIIIPVGGGGLFSGVAVAVKAMHPDVRLWGVQLESSPVICESLKAGRIVPAYPPSPSIAEGLQGGVEYDSVTFQYVQKYVETPMLLVNDTEIRTAMSEVAFEHRFLLEGSGAASLAALTKYSPLFSGRKVVAILSGSNVNPDSLPPEPLTRKFSSKKIQKNHPLFRFPNSRMDDKGANVVLRPALQSDCALIHSFIVQLAEYEHELNSVLTTVADLERDGCFCEPSEGRNSVCQSHTYYFRAVLAYLGDQPVGFALFYDCYTEVGATVYLEDLYVTPAARKRGIGVKLFMAVASHGKKLVSPNPGKVRLQVLDWNTSSIQFYHSLGGSHCRDMLLYRFYASDIESLMRRDLPPDASAYTIKEATPQHLPLVQELMASCTGTSQQINGHTPSSLERYGFSGNSIFRIHIAYVDGVPTAYSLSYPSYSTWHGRCRTIEELYCKPGTSTTALQVLLKQHASEAPSANLRRLVVFSHSSNTTLQSTLTQLGATFLPTWFTYSFSFD
ncbi:threonine ammonia-lyase [Pelomyxa schiedti]|nr:threonine ammonia-lyase [Pelomyxa schiedti]